MDTKPPIVVTVALTVSLLGFSFHTMAVDWSVSGFGTLGYAYEGEDQLAYRRDITQTADIDDNGSWLTDSNFGLQLDGSFNHQWSFTTQWLLDNSTKHDLDELTELAFIRYVPNEHWNFLVGRVGVSAYAAADSRYIDYGHLWVRPSQELYGGIVFDSLDGVGVSYLSNNPAFNWSLKFEYGSNDQGGEIPQTNDDYTAELKEVLSASFEVMQGNWKWQASYANVGSLSIKQGASIQALQSQLQQLSMLGIPGVSEEAALAYNAMTLDNQTVEYYQLAMLYFDGLWTIQTELFQIDADKSSIPQGRGGYALVGYSLDNITPYVMYGQFSPTYSYYSSRLDWGAVNPAFSLLQTGANVGINSVRIDQSTYSLGVRWDVLPQLALKAQVDYIDINEFGYGLWASDPSVLGSGRDAQVYSINLNFIF
ncbi:hypothetical protein VIOR3934_16771 [Vibrio orientalis CIP 102891 = ATCC 33934]|uniref:Porin domain-containing protein n=1 Tax=Vibrio orientalis CIP 102891 = ATCC 33934 TaxID=675816 RepID=C9QM70_VIBOR|nr:hypothetical protein [Vibrio orientalis]EEX93275.1 hypothetical protein VIA_003922 [Vibrio orientalis CIP 102891 = ATCC 33934]EGU50058.1 hypothetical protein VIOR3934_16771 [Vibrio orientalis CIP 102891 = ATCC 33934]